MSETVSKEEKEKSLEYSIKDGAAFSVMTGFGEQYFNPLAIELGATNMQIGLLASLPQLVSSLLQLYTSKFLRAFRSRRKIITRFVLFQALVWIPLALLPVLPVNGRVTLLILFVTLYLVFGQFVGPVWNSLIGDLVDESNRGRFFGNRNMIAGGIAFASLFIAGFMLGVFPRERVLEGYAVIFLIAFIARLVSLFYLTKTVEPPFSHDKTEEFSFPQYLVKLKDTNYGKFALYVAAMNLSVNVAGPFFTVYMLRDLELSYITYTIITAAAALTSFLAMAYWGTIADRFGNKRVLNVCGILVAAVPLLWLFSRNISYLILVQVVSGFAWAGFNLSAGNFIFDNVRASKRTRIFSYHNVLAGTAVFIGAMLGGLLARELTFKWMFSSRWQMLFLISGILRTATSWFFLPKIQEVRDVERITSREFFFKYSGTGPIFGMTYRMITGLHRSLKHIRWR